MPATTQTTTTTAPIGGAVSVTVTSATKGQLVADIAKRYIGLIPYHLGASMTNTNKLAYADCSSFVKFVYAQVGYTLPRTADQQYKATKKLAIASPSTKNLKAGDLLFFGGWNTPDNPPGYAGIQHVGIYMGNGYVVDEGAAVKGNVGTTKLSNYGTHLIAATRPYGNIPAAAATTPKVADPIAVSSATTVIEHWALGSSDTFTAKDMTTLATAIQNGSISGGNNLSSVTLIQGLNSAVGKKYSDPIVQDAIKTALTDSGFSKDSANAIQTQYVEPTSATFTEKDYNTELIAAKLNGTTNLQSIITNLGKVIGQGYSSSTWSDAFQKMGNDTGSLKDDPLTTIVKLLGKLTNSANWLHVGAMLLGVGMVGFGVYVGIKNISSDETPSAPSMPIILKEGA